MLKSEEPSGRHWHFVSADTTGSGSCPAEYRTDQCVAGFYCKPDEPH